MSRRHLFVSVAICACVFGSSLAALTSVRSRIAFEESALSMSRPVPQALSTVDGTAGARLSLIAVPSLPDEVADVPAEIGGMRPSAVASADFDEDGTPDFVAGYAGDGTGAVAIWRGNVDARYPNTIEAQARRDAGTFTEAPFLGVLTTASTVVMPEFVAASDFDGDGNMDAVLTRVGATAISLLSGNGEGGLISERSIELPGSVTAFASGDVGQLDSHDDVVLGLDTSQGPQLVVLRAGFTTFGEMPERISVPSLPSAMRIGRVGDDGPTDIVAVSASTLWMLNGVSPDAVDRRSFDDRAVVRDLPFEADLVTIGNFSGSKRRDIALRDRDGSVHVLAQLGERDFRTPAASLPLLSSLSADSTWRLVENVWEPLSPAASQRSLVGAKLSEGVYDDLVVSDGSTSMSVLVNGADAEAQKRVPSFDAVVEHISTPIESTAVLPMRLNGDALSDLVFVGSGSPQPSAIVSAPRLTFTVINTADMGAGSLRQAILDANGTAGFDAITFAIPGGGPHVITLATELPQVTGVCSIDATTQPGFTTAPIVRLHGGAIVGTGNGFTVVGGSTLIRGFSITGFPGSVLTGNGIFFPSASGDANTVEGNFVGIDTGGVTVIANASDGIRGEAGSDSHTIGGTVASARNVSTANSDGVQLSSTVGAMIQGNYLGPNATGTAGPGNVASGCRLISTTACTVGGPAGSRNIISGNTTDGIVVNTGGTSNSIAGNYIGMTVTGNAPFGNGSFGVNLLGANATNVGGPAVNDRNVITANPGGGVNAPAQSHNIQGNYIGIDAAAMVGYGNGANGIIAGGNNTGISSNEVVQHSTAGINASGMNVSITANNLYGNGTCVVASAAGVSVVSNFIGQSSGGVAITANVICTDNIFVQITQPILVTGAASSDLRRNRFIACGAPPIDLNADGPTPNDAGDGDAGPNGLQNFPVIASAVAIPGGTMISGTLNSTPSTGFEIVFYSNSACNPGEAQTLLGALPVLTDGSGIAMFTVNAPVKAPGSVIVATATNIAIPAPATSELSACTTVTTSSDVSATITDAPDPVIAGGNLTYSITVGNAGPSVATMSTFTQTMPASTTFVSLTPSGGWSCSTPPMGGNGPITCNAPSMAPSSSAVFSITVAVDPSAGGAMLNSSVMASSASPDPVPANNNAATMTSVVAQADFSIVVTDTPDPVAAGTALTLGTTVTNAGPSDATMGSMTQQIPVGTTFAAFTAAPGWSCSTPPIGGTGTVTCTSPAIPTGAVAVFSLTVDVPANAADGSMLTSTSTATSATADPNGANNSTISSTTVSAQADLSITVVGTPDPVVAGNDLTYAINVTNAGPSDAQSVSMTQSTPPGTTFAVVSSPVGWNCTSPPIGGTGPVTCTAPVLANGSTAVFSLTVTVAPGTPDGTNIPATANVSSATTDPNGANDSAGDSTTVAVSADVSIGVIATPNPVVAGTQLTYGINVINSGPSDALSVAVSQATPAGTTFASVSAPPGWNCTAPAPGGTGGVTCTNPVLAAGASASFALTVNVLPSVPGGSTIAATATIASATPDANAGNNSAVEMTSVGASANLTLATSAEPETVNAGETVTYTVTATNLGPSDAVDLAITTSIPIGLAFESATADGGTCSVPEVGATSGDVICAWSGATPVGGTRTAVVTLRALTTLPDGSLVSDSSTVSSSTVDPDTTNNLASGSVTVVQIADLSLTIVNVPDPVGPGSTLVSTMTVTNNGPVAALDVDVVTSTPTGTVFSSIQFTQGTATTPAVGESGPIVISLGDMANGSTAVITIACVVTAGDGESVTTTASLSTLTTDPDPANNAVSSHAVVAITALQSDVSATVTLDPPEVVSGSESIITIEIANAGPDPATDVVMTQTLPPGAFLRAVEVSQGTFTAPAPGSGGTVRAQIGGLSVGGRATVRIAVQVTATTGSSLLITAIASSSSSDPDPFNNTSLEEIGVREGERVILDWLPPDFGEAVPFPPPRSLTIMRIRPGSPPTVPVRRAAVPAAPREPRATLVGYNIYRTNQPGTLPNPANFFTQVPASSTTVTIPTSPGGSFFVVTAQYDTGESGPTNEASGNIPAAELERVDVKNTKIVATGTGFSDEVQVFVDGIPFVKTAKVKKEATRVVQKGNLITGQTIAQYVASRGGVVVVSFRNSNGGIATYRVGE